LETVSHINIQDGVHVSGPTRQHFSDFETHYISVRNKEKRVLSISEIQQLPYPDITNANYNEWKLRKKSIERFLHYLRKKKMPLRILDIGCGNGFMTHLMAGENNEAVGVDVNLTELKQAAIAFPGKNLKWYYLDILNETLPEKPFDIITFGASFQYFKDAKQILDTCKNRLSKAGEIHIIDSPFYSENSKLNAKENSKHYFNKMGVEHMNNYYNHHSYSVFTNYNVEILYDPNSMINKLFRRSNSPFPWIKII